MNTTTATALASRISHNIRPPLDSNAGNKSMSSLYGPQSEVQRPKLEALGRILALPPQRRLAVCRVADWQSAHLPNTIRRNPDASRCIGTSLRYKPASIRIGGSDKMRPRRFAVDVAEPEEKAPSPGFEWIFLLTPGPCLV